MARKSNSIWVYVRTGLLLGHVLVHPVPLFARWRVHDESPRKAPCQKMPMKHAELCLVSALGFVALKSLTVAVSLTRTERLKLIELLCISLLKAIRGLQAWRVFPKVGYRVSGVLQENIVTLWDCTCGSWVWLKTLMFTLDFCQV